MESVLCSTLFLCRFPLEFYLPAIGILRILLSLLETHFIDKLVYFKSDKNETETNQDYIV